MENQEIKKINYNKYLIIEIIIFFSIRIPLLFIASLYNWVPVFSAISEGYLPYCNFEKIIHEFEPTQHVVPPMNYYFFLLEYLIFRDLIGLVHPFLLLCQFFNFYIVYKLILELSNEKSALIGGALMIFFPLSLIFLAFNLPSVFTATFILGALYFFIKDRLVLSAIFLALGTATMYLPAIIIIPLFIYWVKNSELIKFLYYIITFVSTLFLLILPFLIICPKLFIYYMNLSLNSPQSSNISHILFGDLLHIEIFEIFNFKIIILNIIQASILLITVIYFYQQKSLSKKKTLVISVYYFYLVMVLTLYIHQRFIYWAFLILIIIICSNIEISEENLKSFIKDVIIFAIPYSLMSVFCLVYSWNFTIHLNIQVHMYLIILYSFLFSILWIFCILFLFSMNKIVKILIIYNCFAIWSFILYKLSYEFINIKEINIFLSYLFISIILYFNYYLSFRFASKYIPIQERERIHQLIESESA